MTARLIPLLTCVALVLGGCGREDVPPPLDAAGEGSTASLVEDLRAGGHVLVIRHTTTESTTDRVEVVGDCGRQRNLNAQGRREAQELGAALRALRIPVGVVRMSPLCRTRDTAELAFGPRSQEDVNLVSPGVLGTVDDDDERAERLREIASAPPPPATNTVLVTHTGNIGNAFGLSVLEGEALVFRPGPGGPDGGDPPEPVGQIALEDWRELAAEDG
jgi:phosphohistidine phosphatase SixA